MQACSYTIVQWYRLYVFKFLDDKDTIIGSIIFRIFSLVSCATCALDRIMEQKR
jgi:hypothetical protein